MKNNEPNLLPDDDHSDRYSHAVSYARYGEGIRRALKISAYAFVLSVALFIGYIVHLVRITPSIDDLHQVRIAQPSKIVSTDGSVLASFSRAQQERVELKDVSPHVIKALIATEDRRFYQHHGIDLLRIVSGVWHTLGGNLQGGSTITQQLARNLFPEEIGRKRTVSRKLKEIITAIKIENAYSKDRILETYLNEMPFLYNVVGIEMAARTYFSKSSSELNSLESATLVGMLKGPYYYNPVSNPERARSRRNVVLAQMVKFGDMSIEEGRALQNKPLGVALNIQTDEDGAAPHFAAYVRKQAVEWADKNSYDLYADGLTIHTTLDIQLQNAAVISVEREAQALQAIVDVEWAQSGAGVQSTSPSAYAKVRDSIDPFKQFWRRRPDLAESFIRESPEFKKRVAGGEDAMVVLASLAADAEFITRLRASKTRLEAGFVAMEPSTGEVKAWIGSRDFKDDQFDHVVQAQRQPGSTFKPIVYGAALERGLTPDRLYYDVPMEFRQTDGSVWKPTDMSGSSGRSMTLSEGLIYSKNTITAQVMEEVGLPSVVRLARAMGINQSKLDPVPSLALGTSPVTLLEMANAYSTIANSGQYLQPTVIKSITDRNGKVLVDYSTTYSISGQRAMSEQSAIQLIEMMRGVVNKGTGQAVKARFGISADVAGKTGTTQNNADGWFMLMHPNLVVGAWVGFNDSRVTVRSNYWGQGGHNAALLVGDFVRDALKGKLIDAKAEFPHPYQPPQILAVTNYVEDWMDPTAQPQDDSNVRASDSSVQKIIHLDSHNIVIRDGSAGAVDNTNRSPKSAAEIEQILNGMGRDPSTGAAISSAVRIVDTTYRNDDHSNVSRDSVPVRINVDSNAMSTITP